MSDYSDKMLIESFDLLGLTDLSRKIYLYLIYNKPSKARELSIEFSTPKTTILERLYELESLGLVIKVKTKNSFLFEAGNPSTIRSLITRKEREIEHAKNKSTSDINKLEKIFSPRSLPNIEFYEGIEGIKKMYLSTLNSQSDILTYGSLDTEARYLGNFAFDYWNLRANARIKTISVVPYDSKNINLSTQTDNKHLRTCFFYKSVIQENVVVLVQDNAVYFVNTKTEIGTSIHSEEISTSIQSLIQSIKLYSK